MEKLLSAPIEILSRIFQSCDDFPQAIALAATCKHMQSIWKSHAPTIIWAVGKRNIRSFEDVLMAVRATDIVLRSCQAGILPPTIKMNELTGDTRKPTIEELRKVLNMQHLVKCVEYMYFNSTQYSTNLFGYGMLPADCRYEPDGEQETEEWNDKFYRAMYRILLAGAVFTRPYSEPFYLAEQSGRTEFLNHSLRADFKSGSDDLQYLRQFPIYNFDMLDESDIGKWRNIEYETVFGPFCSWLVGDSQARATHGAVPRDDDLESTKDTSQDEAVHELIRLLTAYEHLNCKFANGNGGSKHGRMIENPGATGGTTQTRKVTIILYGIFQPEEITMPLDIEDTEEKLLIATIHPSLEKSTDHFNLNELDFYKILSMMYFHSRSSTHEPYDEHPDPPPTFDLWHFALRHYFDLGFCGSAFWMWRECSWWSEVGGGTAFMPSGWAPVEERQPGRVSWHWRNLED